MKHSVRESSRGMSENIFVFAHFARVNIDSDFRVLAPATAPLCSFCEK